MGENEESNQYDLKKLNDNLGPLLIVLGTIVAIISLIYRDRIPDHYSILLKFSIPFLGAVFCLYGIILILNRKQHYKTAFHISLVISLFLGTLLFSQYLLPELFQSNELTDPSKTENSPANTDSLPPVDKPKTKKTAQNTGNEKKKILVYIHIGQFEKATSKWVETYISMDSLTKISDLKNSNDFETSQNTGCFVSLPKNLQDIVTVSNVSYMIDEKVRINIKDVVLGYSQNGIDNYFAQIYIQP